MAKRKQSSSSSKPARQRTRLLAAEPERAFDKRQSTINSLHTLQDAFGGDEDEQRDSIGFADQDDNVQDDDGISDLDVPDEVYGLDLPQQDQSDQDEPANKDLEEAPVGRKKQYKRKQQDDNRGRFAKQLQQGSEDEQEDDDSDEVESIAGQAQVRAASHSDVDDDDDDEREQIEDDEDDEDEERWSAHQYRVSRRAPGEADSEDDEALELEAEEARRLQRKHKTMLAAEDYGIEQDERQDDKRDAADVLKSRTRRIEDEQDDSVDATNTGKDGTDLQTQNMSKEEAVAYLLKHNPETLALLDDFTAAAERVKQVEINLVQVRQGIDGKEHPALGIMELEHQAITTYLHTLGFYFSILLTAKPPKDLVDKVLLRLSSLRQALATMEELDLTSEKYEQQEDLEDEDEDEEDEDEGDESGMLASDVWDAGGAAQVWSDEETAEEIDHDNEAQSDEEHSQDEEEDGDDDADGDSLLHGMSDAELEQIMTSLPKNAGAEEFLRRVALKQAQKQANPDVSDDTRMDDFSDDDQQPVLSKKAAKKERKRAAKQLVVPELAPISKRPKSTSGKPTSSAASVDDYVEPTSLSLADEADKRSARHSLRFHVSQVNQKAQKRQNMTRAFGGDDDVPRRSKENARREVLKRQQHGASAGGSALDDQDYDEEDLRAAKRVKGVSYEDDGDDDDGHDIVSELKRQKDVAKLAKKQSYDESRLQEKNELLDLAASMPDGPRGATRQILANKGLTPRRKKENRNARVKKRLQYEKAKKKLGSVKSVYKGGLSTGSYEGEKTGIGKQVVKSRKL
ncbi:something about silencing protein 10 [Microbotryomycetes sp. JL201]|nr:something about silencing protein 10 [Microbotryomycetes sp. JL201]